MSIVLRRWPPLAAVAAAVIAFVLVPQGTRAGAIPLTPAVIDPNANVIVSWAATAEGSPVATFQQCSGFGSRSAVITSSSGTGGGFVKAPGAVSYPDVTCTRGIIGPDALYAWRGHIEAGDSDTRDLTLTGRNSAGEPLQVWTLRNAWPSQYIQAFDRVVVVFTHDSATLEP